MAHAQAARHSYADLPAELVRRIFAAAGDHDGAPLWVQDRLRAEATCRAWRRALRGLPLRHLRLCQDLAPAGYSSDAAWEAKKQWVILAQPATTSFLVDGPPEQLTRALHSLDRKALTELTVASEAPKILPRPQIFPNLRVLKLAASSTWDPAWFEQLCQLQCLERLEVRHAHATAGEPPQLWVLSGLATLTRLYFSLLTTHPPAALALRIDLDTLPSLLELLLAIGGAAELCTPPSGAAGRPRPLHTLQRLTLRAFAAAVDFVALPTLTFLYFPELSELQGAATIASATSLRRLALGSNRHYKWTHPWVIELLRHTPRSLRSLEFCGVWEEGVPEAVAGLTQLRVLSLDNLGDGPAAPRLGCGPVWGHLRALRWACEAPIPEAARQATRLEVLYLYLPHPLTLRDLHLLSSLPALRRLYIDGPWARRALPDWEVAAPPEGNMAADLVHRLMPRLETMELAYFSNRQLVEASAGLLLDEAV